MLRISKILGGVSCMLAIPSYDVAGRLACTEKAMSKKAKRPIGKVMNENLSDLRPF
jgi:hypothetical protein